jgi:hypothetical protein
MQAYASSEHRCEDTRKYSVYYSFCLSSPFYIFFTFLSVILLSLFVLFIVLAFSFRVSWFLYLILHICMYTRPFHRDFTEEILFPLRFRTSRALGALAFRCLSLCARRRNPHNLPPSPHSFLEPVSQPSRTLTPATALVCFVLGTASGVPAHQRLLPFDCRCPYQSAQCQKRFYLLSRNGPRIL